MASVQKRSLNVADMFMAWLSQTHHHRNGGSQKFSLCGSVFPVVSFASPLTIFRLFSNGGMNFFETRFGSLH
jgi:hypothetical protein